MTPRDGAETAMGGLAQPVDAATARAWKRAAARAAAAAVPDGITLGLGTGSTADLMLDALAERIAHQQLRVVGVATSELTRAAAAARGIPLAELNAVERLDMSIDGADEVALPALDLIKGRGGALLHEKLIAGASAYRVIIVDASKLVTTLATRHPIPVEVERFGWRQTAARLAVLGLRPTRRAAAGGPADDADAVPFVTDGDHFVLDCASGPIAAPALLAERIKGVLGVVDSGLFIGMTDRVYVAGPSGTITYDRPRAEP